PRGRTWRTPGSRHGDLWRPKGRSFAPAALEQRILRACGAQDDRLPRSAIGNEEGPPSFLFYFTVAARRCHPERARGTRASEGSAPARSFAPSVLRMTGALARVNGEEGGSRLPRA